MVAVAAPAPGVVRVCGGFVCAFVFVVVVTAFAATAEDRTAVAEPVGKVVTVDATSVVAVEVKAAVASGTMVEVVMLAPSVVVPIAVRAVVAVALEGSAEAVDVAFAAAVAAELLLLTPPNVNTSPPGNG